MGVFTPNLCHFALSIFQPITIIFSMMYLLLKHTNQERSQHSIMVQKYNSLKSKRSGFKSQLQPSQVQGTEQVTAQSEPSQFPHLMWICPAGWYKKIASVNGQALQAQIENYLLFHPHAWTPCPGWDSTISDEAWSIFPAQPVFLYTPPNSGMEWRQSFSLVILIWHSSQRLTSGSSWESPDV